ncbi:MAG: hypothetical protein P8012_12825 [Desulfobacterales bacterium]
MRPWIDRLGFPINKAVGAEKPAAFLFLKKEPPNVTNTLYIKYPLYHPACPALPMDNDRAPLGAASWKLILFSLN